MAFPNKRRAKCKTCDITLEVGEGWTEGPPWVSTCNPCSGRAEVDPNAKPKITATAGTGKTKGKVVFKPDGYLDGKFNDYRAACEGGLYNPDLKANVAPFDKAVKIIARLQEADFTVDVAPEVAATLQALTAQTKLDIEGARERALKADEELKARGLYLYPFQKSGINWLAARHGALLGDDMGLGKTIQALIALPDDVPVLVVCPAVAKGVWAREAAKWRPDLEVTVVKGKKNFVMPYKGLVICNYEILPSFSFEHGKDHLCMNREGQPLKHNLEERLELVGGKEAGIWDIANAVQACPTCYEKQQFEARVFDNTVVIADECHALKSSRTKRSQAFRVISGTARDHGGRTWLLSATPLMNRPQELWNIFQAAGIAQEAFGSWRQFVQLFNGNEGNYGGYEWGEPTEEAAERIKRVMLRRLKVDVLPDLPVKRYQSVTVEISAAARKAADKLATYLHEQKPTIWDRILGDEADLPMPDQPVQAHLEELTAALNHVQNTQGALFEQMSRVRALLAKAKIPTLLSLVESFEEQDEPVVVFSAHRAPIDILGEREGWAVITGSTPPERRSEIEDAFQAGHLKGIGCTIKAGGVAITLTRASQAIFVDREMTPALNVQAEDRVCRIGQTRGCIITDLVADHWLDTRVFAILASKQALITASVDAARQGAIVVTEVAEVDFDALAADAEVEADALAQAQAEAAAVAAKRKTHYATLAEERAQREAEEKAQAAAEKKERQGRERAMQRGWIAPVDAPERHPAVTEKEVWADQALRTLSALDPDRASVENGVGFNKADGYIGHYLVPELEYGLTPQQWHLAINMCRKYHGQIGQCPIL